MSEVKTDDLPRRIGFWGGSAIMAGIIIGSGIFRTPPSIAKELGSPMTILSLWVLGGILSLFGALTYAELGTMFPRSGGIYVYLHRGLGPQIAFVFGWTYLLITKPMAAAGIAMVFSEHLFKLLGQPVDQVVLQTTTCVALIVLTAINVRGVRLGAGIAMVFTSLKVMALLMIIGLGIVLMKGSSANFQPVSAEKTFFQAVAPVMAAILWTYDGWSDVASVAGEVKDPQRLLPRIFIAGTAATIALYVSVNAVYMAMIPLTEMRDMDTVAPTTMMRLVGDAGMTVVTVMIMISTLGASHGSMITGARVTFAQARDGLLFGFLGHVHPKYETPDVSLWVQVAMSCAAVWVLQTFEKLAEGFVFTMWTFYALAALAVIILRIREPQRQRPYRCFGYPVVPTLFILAALAMTVKSIHDKPHETLPWLLVLAAGLPTYYVWQFFVRRRGSSPASPKT